ncbi:hypothetical protein Mhun_1202 [Methanospirillum hungatei JF-1]|jgi:hypothetical protein|uniref:Uncharacterized protein n=1 Tax=Methanospirillum hungatei JF-1 (strain ATCC 27890 / DSM 864 / NBRC 100397 / JF-1) TaxID=323259 RepID=Q2FM14_METHJ|nr:hypothetical protein [Methanospirillum hungatei]ABD40949.1 hypothetical protein Mhun_1202 [Methanospirillum hungatei JF-1]MBP9007787.1 hypothetical protein [Methanospirillum sp.]
MRTIRTTDGKWLQIDPKTDPWIFKTPHSSVRASLDYRQGEDLYLRTLPDGIHYYYVISWTDWQRESKEAYRTLSEEEAKDFLIKKAQSAGKIGLDPDILDRIEKYFPGLLKKRR